MRLKIAKPRPVRNAFFSLILALAGALVGVFGSVSVAEASGAADLVGDCSYYDARSTELGCSASEYLLQFGAPYCRKFAAAHHEFSLGAQTVLDRIRVCLQASLEERDDLTCGNVKTIAVDSHVPCYAESGFCQLDFPDKFRLATIISPALADPLIDQAIVRIESECVRQQRPF